MSYYGGVSRHVNLFDKTYASLKFLRHRGLVTGKKLAHLPGSGDSGGDRSWTQTEIKFP